MSELTSVLANTYSNHFMPFLWYAGESTEMVCKALENIKASGIRAITLENRGGNWFGTQRWWDMLNTVLDRAAELDMKVWMLDDSHVATGSANDTLKLEKNAAYRPKNLRITATDVVGPFYGALYMPELNEGESILHVQAYRRDEKTGICTGAPILLDDQVEDGLLKLELPRGFWRIYHVIHAAPSCQGFWAYCISMLSRESCRHLIDEIHEPMYAHCKRHFGKTFMGFFSDEPGFGNCNGEYDEHFTNNRIGKLGQLVGWWDTMPGLLAEELHEDISTVMSNLPGLWDDIEGISRRYQLAYMNVITRLWRDNFTTQIGDWCREHGVQYIGHYVEDDGAHMHMGFGCGDILRTMVGQDMAGIDVVLHQILPGITHFTHVRDDGRKKYCNSSFYIYTLGHLGLSLAHHTPIMHNRVMAEVMGAYGWGAGLSCMRSLFNYTLASGVNYFVPHTFSLIPPDCYRNNIARKDTDMSALPPGYCLGCMPPSFHAQGFNPQYTAFTDLVSHIQRTAELTLNGVHVPDVALYYNVECDWLSETAQDMTQVAETLTRNNLDFDFLAMDMLKKATVKNHRLLVDDESYSALVIPAADIIPDQLFSLITRFAQKGLPVLFVNRKPKYTELAPITLNETGSLVSLKNLPAKIRSIAPAHFTFTPAQPDIRFYSLKKKDGSELAIFLNEGIKKVDFHVSKPLAGKTVLYDPWTNKAYTPEENEKGVRMVLNPQQLLILIFNAKEKKSFPAFRYTWPALKTVPLTYDIYTRNADEQERKLLCQQVVPSNLLNTMHLTRTCAEFFYEADLVCDREYTALQVPVSGDCTTLLINGEKCGTDFGTECTFDITGKLKPGKNHITIITADTPAYADRFPVRFGEKMPLQPHGILKHIRLG